MRQLDAIERWLRPWWLSRRTSRIVRMDKRSRDISVLLLKRIRRLPVRYPASSSKRRQNQVHALQRNRCAFWSGITAHFAAESVRTFERNRCTLCSGIRIRVVEHLYRALNWTITDHSRDYSQTDAHTV